MIKKCKCKHEYQDREHGKHKRVHNRVTKSTQTAWRCTVCGDVKE